MQRKDNSTVEADGSRQEFIYDYSGNNDDLGVAPVETIVVDNKQFGDVRFVLKRHRVGTPQMTADIMMIRKGRSYVGPDVSIGSSKSGVGVVRRPGQSDYPYSYFLSPNGHFVYVDRKIHVGYSAAYVYKVTPGKLVPVLFDGVRLDRFFMEEFTKRCRPLAAAKDFENMVFHFERWIDRPSGYVLRMNVAVEPRVSEAESLKYARWRQPVPDYAAFAEFDVERATLRVLRRVTAGEYNFFPNEKP